MIGSNLDTFHDSLYASNVNLMSVESLDGEREVTAKIRYSHKGAPCRIRMVDADTVLCKFEEPVRAITPGQAVVFYDGVVVIGGAVIDRVAE